MKTCISVICSEQYLPFYRVLYQSIKKYAPNVDNILYFIGNHIPTEFDQIVDITDWHKNTIYKNELVSICSLRARVVLDSFNRGYENVIHSGAKLELFDSIRHFIEQFDNYDAIGTPHILDPLPNDQKWPSNASVSFTGHLSTDWVGFKNTEQIRRFLEWQDEIQKTQTDTTGHKYLDQSWLNFLPFFCEKVLIYKNFGMNVAYWNMFQRGMHKVKDKWFMKDGSPLAVFQYSGLDLNNPKGISKHQNRWNAEGDILQFFEEYVKKVRA